MNAGELGARSLREDGVLKAAMGLTTPEEILGATAAASAGYDGI